MAATKKRRQEEVTDLALTDHNLSKRRPQMVSGLFQPLDNLNFLLQ
jgi:hypothetical protein